MSDKPNTTTLPDGWRIFNKYQIRHTDGTPLKGKQYFVLRLDSDDPAEAARVAAAMAAYKGENMTNLEEFISPGIKFPPPSEEKKRGKQCGITINNRHILAWNYTEGMDIRVDAKKLAGDAWAGELHSNGQIRATIVVRGGRWLANALCRGLRNSMTSWRLKRHRNKANRAARLAAKLTIDMEAAHKAETV